MKQLSDDVAAYEVEVQCDDSGEHIIYVYDPFYFDGEGCVALTVGQARGLISRLRTMISRIERRDDPGANRPLRNVLPSEES